MLDEKGFESEDYSNYKRGGQVSIFTNPTGKRKEHKAAAIVDGKVICVTGRTRPNAISNIIGKLAMGLDFDVDYEWLENDQVIASTTKFPGIFGTSVEEKPAKKKLLKRIYHIRTIILIDNIPIKEDHKKGTSAKYRIETSTGYTNSMASAMEDIAVLV